MKVKMKVKHLFMLLITFILSLSVIIIFVEPKVKEWQINNQIASGEIELAKAEIVSRIERDNRQSLSLIRDYMIERERPGTYDVYIGPATKSRSGAYDRLFTLHEMEPYILHYLEKAPRDGYLLPAAEVLVHHYRSTGEFEKGNDILTALIAEFDEGSYLFHQMTLLWLNLAVYTGEIEHTKMLLNDYRKHVSSVYYQEYYYLLEQTANKQVQSGNLDEAKRFIEEEIHVQEKLAKDGADHFFESKYFQSLVALKGDLKEYEEESFSKVEGKVVRDDGTPLRNVAVYLRDEREVNRSVSPHEKYEAITNQDGEFFFTNVETGNYQIHIGIDFEQIDGWTWPVETYDWIEINDGDHITYDVELTPLIDIIEPTNYATVEEEKVSFRWEEYPGAKTYELMLYVDYEGGSFGAPFLFGIENEEVVIPVEELYAKTVGVIFLEEQLEDHLHAPENTLAFSNPKGTFSWSVRAFDEQGKLIGQSNGYRLKEETVGELPFFHLKERELIEADMLLLDGKVEEALNEYRENVEDDDRDIHSLRMVTRIRESNRDSDSELLPYYLKLAELDSSAENLLTVAKVYNNLGKWEEVEEWLLTYKQQLDEGVQPSSYVLGMLGKSLFMQERINEANDTFSRAVSIDPANRFIGYYLVTELYMTDDVEEVVQIATNNRRRGLSLDPTNWESIVSHLEGVNHEDIQEVIRLYINGKDDQIEELLDERGSRGLPGLVRGLNRLE
ncbi:carboxypeptidase-like regulatory domain-containing protein [Bacillus shivajii]|uniref:carboxypeptidase-like regulatory domain-containing protein n=1 Tax=Bacillus shivajii TaxID=1983719 RepID=UPI001CF9F7B4|nr:carboxypeptidase-like regulatory domain-containing protein [Bacillus shivajii]UCZ54418.1 carboxypeptidase-like regulatory domain-containing protein [Bacillus shivajii]